jgi:hypothetical protein
VRRYSGATQPSGIAFAFATRENASLRKKLWAGIPYRSSSCVEAVLSSSLSLEMGRARMHRMVCLPRGTEGRG